MAMRKMAALVALLGVLATGHASERGETLPDSLSITVRPTDIDAKAHVNNARYVEYLQWGRWEWFDKRGLTNDRLAEIGCVLVVVNLNLNYRSECKQGDVLTVRTTPERTGDKSFVLRQEVLKADGTLALDGLITMVAVDPATRKSRPLPDELAKALAEPKG